MSDPLKPSLSLLSKLGSIVIHVEELHSSKGHAFDRIALDGLLNDPEVCEWLKAMKVFLPAALRDSLEARDKSGQACAVVLQQVWAEVQGRLDDYASQLELWMKRARTFESALAEATGKAKGAMREACANYVVWTIAVEEKYPSIS